jgi:hypothetical protein
MTGLENGLDISELSYEHGTKSKKMRGDLV